MNDKQREYTIKRIEKYNTDINDCKKTEAFYLTMTLISTMVTYICFRTLPGNTELVKNSISEFKDSMRELWGLTAGVYTISNVTNIIRNICRQAGLEHLIADLEYRLELDKLGEQEQEQTQEGTKKI